MIGEKTLRLIVGVFVSGLLARHLGPEVFGQLNYSITLLSIATVVSTLGLNRIFVRMIVSCEVQQKEFIVSTVFFLRFFISIMIWIIGSLVSYLLLHSEWLYISIVLFSLVFCSGDVIELYQQGISDVKGMSVNRSISFFISSMVRVSLVYIDIDIVWFFVGVTFEYFFVSLLAAVFYKTKYKRNLYDVNFFDAKIAKNMLAESWPEIIAGFSAMLFMRMDQVMLKSILGDASVGVYSAATRISEAWYFIPTAIVSATFPSVINAKKVSSEMYLNKLEVLMVILVFISISAAVFISFSSVHLIPMIYGSQYSESAFILSMQCWSGVFLCLGLASGSWYAAEKKLKLNMYRNITGVIVNVISNLYLISKFGVRGAAIGTIISMLFSNLFFDMFFLQTRPIFFMKIRCLFLYPLIKKVMKKL